MRTERLGAEFAAGADAALAARLRAVGLRPTRQRMALGRLLLDGRNRHVSAEALHAEAAAAGARISLATIYNTLNQFTAAGLMREVSIEPGRSQFDTNLAEHHHFLVEGSGALIDVPASEIEITRLPAPPAGTRLSGVDVILRVSRAEAAEN